MNARQVKAAFVHRTTVRCDDKKCSMRMGFVKSVIYTLSDSGKVQCAGVVQPWEPNKSAVTVKCRHIHFIGKEPQAIKTAAKLSEHAEAIRQAFINTMPVIATVPNVGVVEGHIKEIVYWRTFKGNIQCSAGILDVQCPKCTVQVRLNYIQVQDADKEKGC